MKKGKKSEEGSVASHYNASAANYHKQYERSGLKNLDSEYPANYFRMQKLINAFLKHDLNRIIEVGVGEGTPLVNLLKSGMDVSGFDLSEEMVTKAKENVSKNGGNGDHIIWGDIQDPSTYASLLQGGKFDGLLAMGVMPHVRRDDVVLQNMRSMLKPGGRVFIEFRNSLFSLFTFNRYTHDFIVDDLLANVAPELRDAVSKNISKRVEMEKPPRRTTHNEDTDVPGYDAILSKFHNPFEVNELFENNGFEDISMHWYHYHPAMPFMADENAELFRDEALKLEHETSGWRGYFLCSAFVVEARNGS